VTGLDHIQKRNETMQQTIASQTEGILYLNFLDLIGSCVQDSGSLTLLSDIQGLHVLFRSRYSYRKQKINKNLLRIELGQLFYLRRVSQSPFQPQLNETFGPTLHFYT